MHRHGMIVGGAVGVSAGDFARHQARRQHLRRTPGLGKPGLLERSVTGKGELAEGLAYAFIDDIADGVAVAAFGQPVQDDFRHGALAGFALAAGFEIDHIAPGSAVPRQAFSAHHWRRHPGQSGPGWHRMQRLGLFSSIFTGLGGGCAVGGSSGGLRQSDNDAGQQNGHDHCQHITQPFPVASADHLLLPLAKEMDGARRDRQRDASAFRPCG